MTSAIIKFSYEFQSHQARHWPHEHFTEAGQMLTMTSTNANLAQETCIWEWQSTLAGQYCNTLTITPHTAYNSKWHPFHSSVGLQSWFMTGNQEPPHRLIPHGDIEPVALMDHIFWAQTRHAPSHLYGQNPDVTHHPVMHEKMSDGKDSRWGMSFCSKRRKAVCTVRSAVQSSTFSVPAQTELQVCIQLK